LGIQIRLERISTGLEIEFLFEKTHLFVDSMSVTCVMRCAESENWKTKYEQMINDAWMMLQQRGLRLQ
jgi:hypothetical protein